MPKDIGDMSNDEINVLFRDIQQNYDTLVRNPLLFVNIFEGCYEEKGVRVCVEVKYNEVCAELFLVGNSIGRGCFGWGRNEAELRATSDYSTVSTGTHKLETPKLDVRHNLNDGHGKVLFWARYYELEWNGYKKKREWNWEEIHSW